MELSTKQLTKVPQTLLSTSLREGTKDSVGATWLIHCSDCHQLSRPDCHPVTCSFPLQSSTLESGFCDSREAFHKQEEARGTLQHLLRLCRLPNARPLGYNNVQTKPPALEVAHSNDKRRKQKSKLSGMLDCEK